jgi:16S rRNA processing protein RimM
MPESSSKDAENRPVRLVTLGRIGGVFGVRGWVHVQSFTRPNDNLLDYDHWWLNPPESSRQQSKGAVASGARGATQVPDGLFQADVVDMRAQGNDFVAQLKGADGNIIDDRDVAARLVGREIQVDRAEMPEPEEGTFYWADLIGLKVVSTSGANLGVVTDMMDNGAQDVLIIDDEGTQRLIPFVRGPIVQRVAPDEGVIVVAWERDY